MYRRYVYLKYRISSLCLGLSFPPFSLRSIHLDTFIYSCNFSLHHWNVSSITAATFSWVHSCIPMLKTTPAAYKEALSQDLQNGWVDGWMDRWIKLRIRSYSQCYYLKERKYTQTINYNTKQDERITIEDRNPVLGNGK